MMLIWIFVENSVRVIQVYWDFYLLPKVALGTFMSKFARLMHMLETITLMYC